MLDNNTIIWLDGKFVRICDAKIGILTHSLHYGSSVFEGIRAYSTKYGPAIFELEKHITRLENSSKSLFMNLNFSKEEIMLACKEVINKNNLKSAYIRPIAFYDDSNMGLDPSKNNVRIAIIAWEWGKYLNEQVSVCFSKYKRISHLTTNIEAKLGGHYINSILATRDAKSRGFDEALLLDDQGLIAEGPGENVFFIKGKTLITPKPGKILTGITRGFILDIAKNLGYSISEREIEKSDLENFDSAFFTGTAAEVTPISNIEEIKFNTNLVKAISEKFFKIVSGDDANYINSLYFSKQLH